MKNTLASLFFALHLLTSNVVQAQRNIILLIADDLGSDYCGFYENHLDTASMPNVRKLLSRGVRFTNAWSNPICSPTRAGMLTGRYSFRTGVGTGVGDANSNVLDTSEITIPRLLKNANAPTKYSTANIGKWHLHLPSQQTYSYPNLMGYDLFSGLFPGALQDYNNWPKTVNGVTTNNTNYATVEILNDVTKWLGQQNNSKPFFLWMAFNAPHDPFHLPPDSLHSFHNLSGTTADIAANTKPYYKAMIESMDNRIGKLFDWLQANNKMDSTDIIFIGDNGDESTVAQIPRAKGSIYQAGISVPFIISGPSVKNPGRVSNALVNTQDLFATILELAGFANWRAQILASKPVDSKSILPILLNQATEVRPWAFTEVFSPVPKNNSEGKTMRNLNYKLMNFDDGRQEFYNLVSDPNERTNLLAKTLSATDLINYKYLCTEMGMLLGKTVCNTTVPTNDLFDSDKPLIAPNPIENIISVSFTDASPFQFEIFALDGKVLKTGVSQKEIPVSNLNSGIYVLKIHKENTLFCEKIVIQHLLIYEK